MARATNIRRRCKSWIVYLRVDGKQSFKSFADRDHGGEKRSKEAALLYLAQTKQQKIRGEYRAPSQVTFREFAAAWLDSHPSIDTRTRVLYTQRIRDYLNPVLGDRRLT